MNVCVCVCERERERERERAQLVVAVEYITAGIRSSPNECPTYDTKLSEGENPDLEFLGEILNRVPFHCLLLPGPI